MIIYLTRHGQTNLNKARLMQGLTDEPLNETGLAQARAMRGCSRERATTCCRQLMSWCTTAWSATACWG